MASRSKRLEANLEGDFFVDSSCIDCGTCRQVAPEVFAEGADWSYVQRQPSDEAARRRARMALIACPVAAIGTETHHRLDEARSAFPELIEDGVHYCGYAAEASYGARSYLVVRPHGNILIDSPRFASALVERIAALGGVRWMFLTHRDDVADHARFHERFGCERILHAADVTAGTRDVERRIDGSEPVELDADALVIPLPGHTPGSAALLYQDRFLFAGDHAWWDDSRGRVAASRSVCWYDWQQQTGSMARLAQHRFEWLLPGHGQRGHLPASAMADAVRDCAERMRHA
jgi:glyoxylase-like metal-dependent hydrolase (beta-lactamase superfamily II)/ferredoxin